MTQAVFGGVDLSLRHDLTSRVLVRRERARRPEAKDHLVVCSIRTWDPQQSPTKEVPFDEVRADLAQLPRRFPGLQSILVDAGAESSSVLPWARQQPRLALIVQPFTATVETNMQIWSALVGRLNARTLSIPRHDRLLAELRGLRMEAFSFGSRFRVVDSARKFHRDVSFALALAVYAAGQAVSCAYCDDPDCGGPDLPPLMLLSSFEYRAWAAKHFPEPDEVEDEPLTAPAAASVDDACPGWGREMYRSTVVSETAPVANASAGTETRGLVESVRAIGVSLVSPLSRVSAALRGLAGDTQVASIIDRAGPPDEADGARRRAERQKRRELAQNQQRRDEADARAEERRAAGRALIVREIQRKGFYWPSDFRR